MTDSEFQDLVDRSLEGTLSEEEARPLWTEVLADEGRRARFVEERELHHDLRRFLTPGAGDGAFLQGVLSELSTKRKDESAFARDIAVRAVRKPRGGRGARADRNLPWNWLIAAAALLAVALFTTTSPTRPRTTESVRISPPVPDQPAPVNRPPVRTPEPAPKERVPLPAPPEPPNLDEKPAPVPPLDPASPPATPEPPKSAPPEPPPRRTRVAIAQADRVCGDAVLLDGNAQTPLKEGDPIFAGLAVRSAGEQALISVRFQDGTRLQLSGDAVACDLAGGDAVTGKSLTLSEGQLTAEVMRQPAGRPLVIHTPHARVQVLGTQFVLTVTADATGLEVEEGRVRLVRLTDGASADVGKDQHAVVSKGPAPLARPLANLLADPGFEMSGQGWMMFRPEGGLLFGRRIVPGGLRGGARALEIEAGPYPHQAYQDTPASAGTSYRIKGWIRSKDLQAGRVELLWLSAPGLSDMPVPSTVVRTDVVGTATGTTDWAKVSGRFRAPAGARAVRIRIVAEAGTGLLWADDLRLTRNLEGK